MFEIAFKVNPDSDFYKNYFIKKAEKKKFLKLANKFLDKYFWGEWLSLNLSGRLTIRLNAEGTQKYAQQTTRHSNCPGFSTFKKQSPMNRLWEDEVCKCADWKKFSANDFWWMNFHGTPMLQNAGTMQSGKMRCRRLHHHRPGILAACCALDKTRICLRRKRV